MSEAQSFEATLWRLDARHAQAFITLPFDAKAEFGRARCPVLVSIRGYTWRTTIQPFSEGYHLAVPTAVREIVDLAVGDVVLVEVTRYEGPSVVDMPPELDEQLRGHRAAEAFGSLPPSHRREYAMWVSDAKWPETRRRRATEVARRLQPPGRSG